VNICYVTHVISDVHTCIEVDLPGTIFTVIFSTKQKKQTHLSDLHFVQPLVRIVTSLDQSFANAVGLTDSIHPY